MRLWSHPLITEQSSTVSRYEFADRRGSAVRRETLNFELVSEPRVDGSGLVRLDGT